MKETKNNKESKGTKGLSTKPANAGEKKVVEKTSIKTLMMATAAKLSTLAKDVSTVPRKKYTGWKLGSKLLVTIGPRNKSFMMWVYEYSEKTGARKTIEPFEIKTTGKASEDVIAGLIKQVRKNYTTLKAKAAKPAPKKETFKEAKIVEEIPLKTKKEVKKEEKKDEKNSN